MVALAITILFTGAALLLTGMVCYGNGMRSSPGPFQGLWIIIAGWSAAALLWIWWLSS